MTLTYKEQLLHPNWQRRRLERLELADFTCEECGDKEKTLHVHHPRYFKGRMAWAYSDDELAVLCASCHSVESANREILDGLIARCGYGQAIGLIAGYLDGSGDALDDEITAAATEISGYTYVVGMFASFVSGDAWSELTAAVRCFKRHRVTPKQQFWLRRWERNE